MIKNEEITTDALEGAGRRFIRAYESRLPPDKIRYAWRVFCEIYIMRKKNGDDLPAPHWKPSPRRTRTGYGDEIQWVSAVIDEITARRRIL